MFEKDDKAIRLALSVSEENDRRIVDQAESSEAERLHQLAMNPDATVRRECGLPRR